MKPAAALFMVLALTASEAGARPYRAPRTAFGAPDLQGVWDTQSMTRLQRPKAFKDLVATPYAAAAYEKKRVDRYESEVAPLSPDAPAPTDDKVEDDAAQWSTRPPGLARIDGQIRTSLIVEPADGRLPFTPASRAASEKALADEEVYDDPEGRPFDERCLLGGGGGSAAPILNADLLQIVQSRDAILILGEHNHDARIVRLTPRHAPPAVTPWMGDPIGWWEGDTLVVETTNLSPTDRWRWNAGDWIPLSAKARIVERFTRVGPGEIRYAFAVSDPANYTADWRGEMPLRATAARLLEYACHEGNYALRNILAGARAQERAKPQVAATSP